MKIGNYLPNTFNSPRRISIAMGALKLFKAAISLLIVILSAKYFGASLERDAWIIGTSVATVLLQALFGPVNDILRTKFLYIKDAEGEEYVLKTFSSLLSMFIIIASVIVIASTIFPSILVHFFAPGFTTPIELQVSRVMILLLLPTIIINELTALFSSLLNCYNSFFVPDICSIFSLVINIALILFFASSLGIYTLIIANYLSTLLLLFVLLKYLSIKKIKVRFGRPRWIEVKPYLSFALPFYISYFVAQVNVSIERALSTRIGVGNISMLDYARKFVDLPILTILAVVTSVLTPLLVQLRLNKDKKAFQDEALGFLRLSLILVTPLVVLFSVCGESLLRLLLVRGNFTEANLEPTATTLKYLGLGLPGVICYIILGQVFIVQKRTYAFALYGILIQVLATAFNILFYRPFGIPFFALTWGGAHLLFTMIMLVGSGVLYDSTKYNDFIKSVALLTLSTLACMIFNKYIIFNNVLISIFANVFLSIVSVCIFMYVFNFEERRIISRLYLQLRKKTKMPNGEE